LGRRPPARRCCRCRGTSPSLLFRLDAEDRDVLGQRLLQGIGDLLRRRRWIDALVVRRCSSWTRGSSTGWGSGPALPPDLFLRDQGPAEEKTDRKGEEGGTHQTHDPDVMQGRSSGVSSVPHSGQGAPGGGPARKRYVRMPIASPSPTLPLSSASKALMQAGLRIEHVELDQDRDGVSYVDLAIGVGIAPLEGGPGEKIPPSRRRIPPGRRSSSR